jgi:hypothetical protein
MLLALPSVTPVRRPTSACALALLAAACATTDPMDRAAAPPGQEPPFDARGLAPPEEPRFPLDWEPGQVLLQGYLGAKYLSDFRVERGGDTPVELDDDEYEVLPVVGGGAQMKLTGGGFDLGIEGFLALAGRTDLEAFAAGSGGAVLAFDVDLFLVEAFGGLFVSRFLGERVRLHGGAGPLLQWAGYDQDDGSVEEDSDGSGGGLYARAGLEFLLPSGELAGFGVRWSDSSVDLGGDAGDLDLRDLEVFFSYSYGHQPRHRFP